jgi:hypothetical protein
MALVDGIVVVWLLTSAHRLCQVETEGYPTSAGRSLAPNQISLPQPGKLVAMLECGIAAGPAKIGALLLLSAEALPRCDIAAWPGKIWAWLRRPRLRLKCQVAAGPGKNWTLLLRRL